ncbi:hypothetical protein EX895_001257 [Sporisorium graminicola]|uniref:Uncharacterized protein n=1 Tax=Sporisorium graminicola TaxID=280036 RepID=A0A4V6EUA4_9BASI|nr:hypothetical protein EX895_001257 [Sporisorium graminicola]TKY89959.1 hypothetical protein EX895_001257 [Sporisorium graminicola]
MIKRDLEFDGEEGIERRTRIDDTDPRIVFSPGPSPYFDQQQNASWSVVKDSTPFNGSAVMANLPDAQLSFNFTGNSLTLGLLYRKDGTRLNVTLENGTSFPIEVTAADTAASAHDGEEEALQKKNVRLTGLSCAKHTVILAALPASDAQGGNATQAPLYFDWFSFPSADSAAACTSSSPGSPAPTRGPTLNDNHTMMYIGISLGAILLCFIVAILVTRYFRRRDQHRRPSSAAEPVHHTFRSGRKQASNDTLDMPLNMSQPQLKSSLETATIFRPRGIHALAHDDSFSSSHTGPRPSILDSPSATAVSATMPLSQEEGVEMVEDAEHSIGSMLLCLQHDPLNRPRDVRSNGSKAQYDKARLSSSVGAASGKFVPRSPILVGGHELQRIPKDDFIPASTRTASKGKARFPSTNKIPRRPTTASAIERLCTDAQHLDIQRSLSPFDHTRPITSSGAVISSKASETTLSCLATTPALSNPENPFRRNSIGSVDSRWSCISADVSSLEGQKDGPLSKGDVVEKVEKTVDSEADMWVTAKAGDDKKKGKKRRSSIADVPKRPPKSPHRPSTGHGAPPPATVDPPFTIG